MLWSRARPNEKFFHFIAESFLLLLRRARPCRAYGKRHRNHQYETQFPFHAKAAFIPLIPEAQLDSFEFQLPDFPMENFHSASGPGNLGAPDRSTTSRLRECFESRKQLGCCRLRESEPPLC